MISGEHKTSLRVSVIIPTLDEATSICRTLDSLARLSAELEIIVVDGGSSDRTPEIVHQRGVRLITSQLGRGKQMHAGACASTGEVLWFLHADTQPPHNAIEFIAAALCNPQIVGGSFDVEFDSRRFGARFVTSLYRVLRRVGIIYGDSAIFVQRAAYEAAGGFRPLAIFEDLDFLRRLRRCGQLARLSAAVVTSSRRFEGSFVNTFSRWTLLQLLYWIGISPDALGKLYAPIRAQKGDPINVLLQRK